jgi:hypothetical protein
MKQILLLACLLLIGIYTFSQTSTISWYKMFKGKIDKYSVTLHLHKTGYNYDGYYYYDLQQKLLYFSGDDKRVKGKIQLISYGDREEAEFFIFLSAGNTITGEWKKTDKSRPLAFSAVETSMSINFAYVFTSGSTKLRPKWKESPEASFNAASVWPTGKTPTDEFLKTEIRHSFNEKSTGEEIGALLLRSKKQFFTDFIDETKDLSDTELKQETMVYSMESDGKLLVAYHSPKILSLAHYSYSYTGGAHGNYGTSYITINLTSNKVLALDNIINDAGRKQLRSLLEKEFRNQYNLRPTDSLSECGLFENKIEPNENFYITEKGIGFCYVPYEIGSYVMGQIEIFIPFADLKNYLKADFKTLMK